MSNKPARQWKCDIIFKHDATVAFDSSSMYTFEVLALEKCEASLSWCKAL